LRDRDNGDEIEFQEGPGQGGSHSEEVRTQDASALFFPLPEENPGGPGRDQNRVTSLQAAPPQIVSLVVQTDGDAAGRAQRQ
jgi:hypothetical protein